MPGVFHPRCQVILIVRLDGFGGTDSEPLIVGERQPLVPKSASVRLNGYAEADTFEVQFDARRLPFSPELIRSAAVQLYMFGVAGAEDDPQRYLEDEGNVVIHGIADDASFQYDASSRSFSFTGRDYTALMLDREWDPERSGVKGRIPTGKPLDETVQLLVNQATQEEVVGRTLDVEFRADGAPPEVGQVYYKTKKKRGVPVSVSAGKNYWDVIYRLCLRHGYVAFVERTTVVITTPQTLTAQAAADAIEVAYGRNLSMLTGQRHLGRETVPQIRVSSYDPTTGKLLTAVFPEKKDTVTTSLGTKKDEVQLTVANGVTDLPTLKRIAETRYNHLARAESKYRFRTIDLKDLSDRDLLRELRPPRACKIGFDEFTQNEEFRQLSEAQRVRRLQANGYSDEVAGFIAANVTRLKEFTQPFYTREVQLDWSIEDGIAIEGEVMNFVCEGRDDASSVSG